MEGVEFSVGMTLHGNADSDVEMEHWGSEGGGG